MLEVKYSFQPRADSLVCSLRGKGVDQEQRKGLIDKHRDSFERHGYSPNTLYWVSRGVQKARFKVLAEIGVSSGDSLLDIGCGFADLNGWLLGHDVQVEYTGLDLSPDIAGKAASLHPQAEVLCGELFDFDWPPQSFDWVMLSGTLNWQLNDDGAYARRVIQRMFELCRDGVAFNLLNLRHRDMRHMQDLVAFDPDEILAFCAQLTPDCRCRTDYMANDFTIYMQRVS